MTQTKSTAPSRFTIQSHGDSYEVIDQDGRPVTEALPYNHAREECSVLNAAAPKRKSLAIALGCTGD